MTIKPTDFQNKMQWNTFLVTLQIHMDSLKLMYQRIWKHNSDKF